MKKSKYLSLLSLVMSLVLLLSAFCGCGKKVPDTPGDATSGETVTTEGPGEGFELVEKFDIIVDGESKAPVTRPDKDANDAPSVLGAVAARKNLALHCKRQEIATDWNITGDYDHAAVEIVFGNSVYEESAAVQTPAPGSFVIAPVKNKIIVKAVSEAGYLAAAEELKAIFDANTVKNGDKETISVPRSALSVSKVYDEKIARVPAFDGGTFLCEYDASDITNQELIYENATEEGFRQYMQKLETAGYTKYTVNEVMGNIFAIYYNKDYTLNVGYYKYNNNVRIIEEDYSPATLPGLEADNKFTPVTTSQITMLGVEYVNAEKENVGNGMSILIRLTDGRFVVIDGAFNRANNSAQLISRMQEQSKDYIGSGRITVAAWILTHPHGDHLGLFNSQRTALKNAGIKIEKLICNFASKEELDRMRAKYPDNVSATEGNGYATSYSAAKEYGATLITPHVGQIFWFADVKMEVLYTMESHFPQIMNAVNAMSIIIKMTFKDPVTGKETVYMSTGDATGAGMAIAASTFGSYLKSDLVQVAHHGYTTWKNDGGTIAAYKLMAPETVVWPQGKTAHPNYTDKSYNKALTDLSSNPNYKEKYVAGLENEYIIFPMPYTAGTATVVRR